MASLKKMAVINRKHVTNYENHSPFNDERHATETSLSQNNSQHDLGEKQIDSPLRIDRKKSDSIHEGDLFES